MDRGETSVAPMPEFAANLSMLFCEHPFLDRFAAARAAGFEAVEIQFPYSFPAAEIARRLDGEGLTLVLHNIPGGDWEAGERGLGALAGGQREFREAVAQALDYAAALGCAQLNCLAGVPARGADPREARKIFVDNVAYAADALAGAGRRLLIEAINTRDVPGFHLHRTQDALDVLAAVSAPNLFIQYDAYHMHIMEGGLARTIEDNLAAIGHIQIADAPGRREPGTGEIDFPSLFGHLDRIGYRGWVGCEYLPEAGTLAGLGWLTVERERASKACDAAALP